MQPIQSAPGTVIGDKVVIMTAPVKGALRSGIVRKILYSQAAALGLVLTQNSDDVKSVLEAVLPWPLAAAVPMAMYALSAIAALFAIRERAGKPDLARQPLLRMPDDGATLDVAAIAGIPRA